MSGVAKPHQTLPHPPLVFTTWIDVSNVSGFITLIAPVHLILLKALMKSKHDIVAASTGRVVGLMLQLFTARGSWRETYITLRVNTRPLPLTRRGSNCASAATH